MIQLVNSSNDNLDFLYVVNLLNQELAIKNGDLHDFYNQYNGTDALTHVILGYKDEKCIACGALKSIDQNTYEVKRMYVVPHERSQGYANAILEALEKISLESGIKNIILETGTMLPEAIKLYTKSGYKIIDNYGQYIAQENSICFKKII